MNYVRLSDKYVTDTKYVYAKTERIISFRTGADKPRRDIKSTCDLQFTFKNPIAFEHKHRKYYKTIYVQKTWRELENERLAWKEKVVHLKEKYGKDFVEKPFSQNPMKRTRILIDVPYTVYKKETRPVKEWANIVRTVMNVNKEVRGYPIGTVSTNDIIKASRQGARGYSVEEAAETARRLNRVQREKMAELVKLAEFIQKVIGPLVNCGNSIKIPRTDQHFCLNTHSEVIIETNTSESNLEYHYNTETGVVFPLDQQYSQEHRNRGNTANVVIEPQPEKQRVYNRFSILASEVDTHVSEWYTDPIDLIQNNDFVRYATSVLWPGSEDYASRPTPAVDIAEAVADGTFLSEPPNLKDSHTKMVKSVSTDLSLSSKALKIGGLSLDLFSNLWLWTSLVFEPVLNSIVAMAASLETADRAAESFMKKVKNGQWIQGKSVRLCEREPSVKVIDSHDGIRGDEKPEGVARLLKSDLKLSEINGNMIYRVDLTDLVLQGSSLSQLSHFFQRMSNSWESLLYNVTPLSFVFDMFSARYAESFTLDSKVRMPLSDWKVTLSYKCKDVLISNYEKLLPYSIGRPYVCTTYKGQVDDEHLPDSPSCSREGWLILEPTGYTGEVYHENKKIEGIHANERGWSFANQGGNFQWKKVNWVYKPNLIFLKQTELINIYKRVVHDKPSPTNEFVEHDFCVPPLNSDFLNGKGVTLGALIWSSFR